MEESERRRLAPPGLGAGASWPDSAVTHLSPPNALANFLVPAAATAFVFVAVLVVAALNQHVLEGKAGALVQTVRAIVPLSAASVAVWCIYRPWPGFLAVLALTPVWNTTAMSWYVGPIQVIFQTVFAGALVAGCLREAWGRGRVRPFEPEPTPAALLVARHTPRTAVRALSTRYSSFRFVEIGALGIVALAVLSTIASPNPINSAAVLLHGILEPVAMAAVLVWLRPNRSQLMLVGAALATSIALGTAINVFQTLPLYKTLSALQLNRVEFAWATYYNVGLFGGIAAMVMPLTLGLLAVRRSLRLSPLLVSLLWGLMTLSLAGLFFSFSKSSWVAAAAGTAILLLLLAQTWRRRVTLIVAATAVSALLIPWPALVLQAAPPANAAYRSMMVALVGETRFDSWNPSTLAGRGSMVERFYAIEGGVNMALDHPILGVGLNQFHNYYIDLGYKPSDARDLNLDHAHSLFPEVAAELGVPAVALLLVVFGAAMWAMWRTHRSARDDQTRILAAAILAGVATWVLAATAFGCDIYRPERDQSADVMAIAVLLAMAVALARATNLIGDSHDDRQTPA